MTVIWGRRAVYRFHLQAVTQERAAPCMCGIYNFFIIPCTLGVLLLCSGQERHLLEVFTSLLSAHLSAAIVSCTFHTVTCINMMLDSMEALDEQ